MLHKGSLRREIHFQYILFLRLVINRAFRIDTNCVEAQKYHYLYLLCKEGNYSDVNFQIKNKPLKSFVFWFKGSRSIQSTYTFN